MIPKEKLVGDGVSRTSGGECAVGNRSREVLVTDQTTASDVEGESGESKSLRGCAIEFKGIDRTRSGERQVSGLHFIQGRCPQCLAGGGSRDGCEGVGGEIRLIDDRPATEHAVHIGVASRSDTCGANIKNGSGGAGDSASSEDARAG